MNCGKKRTDQQYQQVSFHVFLRCAIAANNHGNAKAVPSIQ
jgi:hypothetical protein